MLTNILEKVRVLQFLAVFQIILTRARAMSFESRLGAAPISRPLPLGMSFKRIFLLRTKACVVSRLQRITESRGPAAQPGWTDLPQRCSSSQEIMVRSYSKMTRERRVSKCLYKVSKVPAHRKVVSGLEIPKRKKSRNRART